MPMKSVMRDPANYSGSIGVRPLTGSTRGWRHWIVGAIELCLAVGLFASSRREAAASEPEKDGLLSKIIHEAFRNSRDLVSAKGEGAYTASKTDGNTKQVTVYEQAKVRFCFDGKKYQLKLAYAKSTEDYPEAIIINDGSAIFRSVFSPRIRPVGAKGEIFNIGNEITNAPMAVHVWYNPAMLADAALPLDYLIKKGLKIRCDRLSPKVIRGRYTHLSGRVTGPTVPATA